MAEAAGNRPGVGGVLIKVQEDLQRLRDSVTHITVLDLQTLQTAIANTEQAVKEHVDEYLNSINNHIATLPLITDTEESSEQLATWKPQLDLLPLRRLPAARTSVGPTYPPSGQQHKLAANLKIMCNPANPSARDVLNQKYGVQLPMLSKRRPALAQPLRASPGSPGSCPPVVFDRDRYRGVSGPQERGLNPPTVQISVDQLPVSSRPALLFDRDKKLLATPKTDVVIRADPISGGEPGSVVAHKGIPAPPPSLASIKSAQRQRLRQSEQNRLVTTCEPKSPSVTPVQMSIARSSDFCFTICNGILDDTASDFLAFKQCYFLSWGSILSFLEHLLKLLKDYAVPMAVVNSQKAAELAVALELEGLPTLESLLSVLENEESVRDLVQRPGQRYKGQNGTEMAAIKIQSCWRRFRARGDYVKYRRQRWAAGVIAISWLLHAQMTRMKKALKESRKRHLEMFHTRAKHLAANWNHIRTSRRTIIHIPSLGFSLPQRLCVTDLDIEQNLQMGRLCDIQDPDVDVIYVSPVQLGDDLLQYYHRFLRLTSDISDERVKIITPEAIDHFRTHSMSLSTLLKYSPRTLKRIRNLIRGRSAYIVGGVLHSDDLDVAEALGVPILGSAPQVAQLYGSKSGSKRLFSGAGVPVPPGAYCIYNQQQMYEVLAQLVTSNLEVKCWLFKMDNEFGGWGTAYCDVTLMKSYKWALKEFRRYGFEKWSNLWAQEPALLHILEELPGFLEQHVQLVTKVRFSSWDVFLEAFLSQGGVVEAVPPSDSITNLTVDMLVEPNGEVSMMSCGDQIHAGSPFQFSGSTVPQSSMEPTDLHTLCMRIGETCKARGVLGYFSIDFVTFLHPRTMQQQVWATDLDLRYSDQLSMTQLMLMMSGGTLDCRSSSLEVPLPMSEVQGQDSLEGPGSSCRYAVMCPHLRHTNLSMVQYKVFLHMCQALGVGFDIKECQGTLLILHDNHRRQTLGMLTIADHLQGALMTFARNLSAIHQEISAPSMQGESNFQGLIKDIEGILGIAVKNQASAEMPTENLGTETTSAHP
ncbi:IQ motif-containing protein H isoform X1 [Polypterus senegalus]|uniref:IQ motif-containing protein H isoform X1 n=1 Tax=Polypterus senegalus TaxID=55291 RepID=UPI001965F8F7|nr:IQ motif-containing protein H isoform X1 [Polypterus senegalus]